MVLPIVLEIIGYTCQHQKVLLGSFEIVTNESRQISSIFSSCTVVTKSVAQLND